MLTVNVATSGNLVIQVLLEQCAFQVWSWSIFDSETSFRLLMVQDHRVQVGLYGKGPYGPVP